MTSQRPIDFTATMTDFIAQVRSDLPTPLQSSPQLAFFRLDFTHGTKLHRESGVLALSPLGVLMHIRDNEGQEMWHASLQDGRLIVEKIYEQNGSYFLYLQNPLKDLLEDQPFTHRADVESNFLALRHITLTQKEATGHYGEGLYAEDRSSEEQLKALQNLIETREEYRLARYLELMPQIDPETQAPEDKIIPFRPRTKE